MLRQWLAYLGGAEWNPLPRSAANVAGIAGLYSWNNVDGNGTPSATINTTDRELKFATITMPAKSVAIHPSPTGGVAAGWRSPISGRVRIGGAVKDGDANCGNGIEWSLKRHGAGGTTTLASGSFENGSSQAFEKGKEAAALVAVDVSAGDLIELAVLPKGEYSCDTTIVELEIAELGTRMTRTWKLAADVAGDPVTAGKNNPHSDRYGNAGVWMFYDLAKQSPAAELPRDSAILRWARASAAGKSAEYCTEAAAVEQSFRNLHKQSQAMKTAGKDDKALTGSDAAIYRDFMNPRGRFWAGARSNLESLGGADLLKMRTEQLALQKYTAQPAPMALAMLEGGCPETEHIGTHDVKVHIRGRYDRLGPVVPRRFPRVLAGDIQPPITKGSGRLDLAKWLASPENPQTARVMVNRIWQHHFGEGIVRTPNNYGKLGTPPTHPELLDHLAIQFVKSGWSIKAMHRAIMLSSVYQQSSQPDPATLKTDADNLLFGRMNRQRLDAEEIRDALLAVSGKLDPAPRGPSVNDLLSARRTIYLMTVRSDRSTYRMLFDAADPGSVAEKRIDSTVAPQALFLLNHPLALQQTRALAESARQRPGPDTDRIQWLYQRLYGRPATGREVQIGQAAIGGGDPAAWEGYCQVLLLANEFVYVD
jgi:hypothetical protein